MRAMSDYRRLISYIYAYEGGEKGKNIGFAKIDMRGPQCRIQVNVKKVYVGSSDVGVYLLHAGGDKRARVLLPVLQLADADTGHAAAGAHPSPVRGCGDVCLVHHHVFPLLAP